MLGRCTRVLCELAALTALALLLVTGIATWRLSLGPVPLNFLTSHVENALNDMFRPVRVSVQGTNLAWAGWERTLDIRVMGTKISGADGVAIARIPEMSVSFSLRALLRGIVAPTNLDLIGPRLQVVRSESGTFALTLEETTNLQADTLGGVVAALSAPKQDKGILRYLKQVSILNAKLVVDDRVTGVNWGAPQADFVVIRDDNEIRASLFADVNAAGKPTRLIAKANLPSGAREFALDLAIENFPLDRLASSMPGLEVLNSVDVTVSGDIAARVGLDGKISGAKFEFFGGAGRIRKPRLWPKGIPLTSIDFRGHYESDPASLEIERFEINAGGPVVSLTGSAIAVGGEISFDGRAGASRVRLSRLKNYWPVGFGKVARRWVLGNMQKGYAENARASFSIRIPDNENADVVVESFSGKVRLRDVTIRYNENFPNLKKVEATAVFSKNRIVANISSGVLEDLKIVTGVVKLFNLDTDKEAADIRATVSGPLRTALTVTNNKPLRLVSKFGVDATTVKGWSTTDLKFTFPLFASLTLDHVNVQALAKIVNAVLLQTPLEKPIKSGNFDLVINRKGLSLVGDAKVAETPVELKWTEPFGADRKFVRRYELRGKIDPTAQKQLLDLPNFAPYVVGPVDLDLSLIERLNGIKEIAAKISLKETTLKIPELGWNKKPGEVGIAWVSLVSFPDGASDIQNIDIQAPGLHGKAVVRFDKANKFLSAKIEKFVLGRSDFGGVISASQGGGYDVQLKGKSLDFVPMLAQVDNAEGSTMPQLNLTTNFETVWFDPDVPVHNVSGTMMYDGEFWNQAALTGVVAKNQPFSYELKTVADKQRYTLRAEDAGGILAGLDITDTFRGGELVLTADRKRAKEQPWKGSLNVSDFAVADAPNLARILTLASLTGIVNRLSGKGIAFTKLEVPFTQTGDTATMTNARAMGAALGLTADGTLDLEKKTASLRGTIVPAYSINSALGKIPLIGRIFTGQKGGGVFAATYQLSGDLAKPKITVNPLAALAPGFLRNLIGILGTESKGKPPSSEIIDPN